MAAMRSREWVESNQTEVSFFGMRRAPPISLQVGVQQGTRVWTHIHIYPTTTSATSPVHQQQHFPKDTQEIHKDRTYRSLEAGPCFSSKESNMLVAFTFCQNLGASVPSPVHLPAG